MDYTELFTSSAHDEGAEVQLNDMEGKPVDMYLTVSGVDSKVWRKEKHLMERRVQLNAQLPEAQQIKIDPDEAISEAFANCVLGWRGFTVKGKKIKFTHARMKELFIEAPYLRDHVDLFFSKRANFIKGKPTE